MHFMHADTHIYTSNEYAEYSSHLENTSQLAIETCICTTVGATEISSSVDLSVEGGQEQLAARSKTAPDRNDKARLHSDIERCLLRRLGEGPRILVFSHFGFSQNSLPTQDWLNTSLSPTKKMLLWVYPIFRHQLMYSVRTLFDLDLLGYIAIISQKTYNPYTIIYTIFIVKSAFCFA